MLDKADDIILAERIKEITLLLKKHLKGELSSEEQIKLDAWVNESEQNKKVFQKISNEEVIADQVKNYYNLLPQIEEIRKRHVAETARIVNMFSKKTMWPRYIAAASVVLMLTIGGYFYLKDKTQQVATTPATPSTIDIPPAGNKAILTLANGSNIILDSAAIGTIAQQEKTTVRKTQEGELIYNTSSSKLPTNKSLLTYNTISTPRGGKYQLTLPDGSKVWLNAASSLRFPIAFAGNERKVELTGEAYFEIIHNASQPFKVAMIPSSENKNKGEITVLGTHFNANAYEEEDNIKVTLLEGAVKVSKSSEEVQGVKILKPGQQAILNTTTKDIGVIGKDDPESAIAWIRGQFSFDKVSFASMMRELSRWYDVQVVYDGVVPTRTINGEVDNTIPLSELLATLEKMGNTRFKIEGRAVRVIP